MPSAPKGFLNLGLHDRVLDSLNGLGFKKPTPVQNEVITPFYHGKDLIVEAPTGTGKTAAYGLPLISKLNLLKRSTQALVLAPSRELAVQITSALSSFFIGPQLSVGLVAGGSSIEESHLVVKSAPHILVAVPGRLREITAMYPNDYLWRDIRHLIVDEGDKLLESGFQHDFKEIRSHIRSTVQMAFFSATISADAEKMMREYTERPIVVRLSPKVLLRHLRFHEVMAPPSGREAGLALLLASGKVPRALIFCSRRLEIFSITGFLLNQGFRAESYYGAQTPEERQAILEAFREGRIDYLVASDLAARGLDVHDLDAVVNLFIPEEYDYYLHRAGRTGRAGREGHVWSLVATEMEGVHLHRHHSEMGLPIVSYDLKAKTLPAREADQRWVKVHISRGKKDKIRRGDVVGFLVNQLEIPAEKIGVIILFDTHCLATVPESALAKIEGMETLSLKGKTVKVRKFGVEEQEKVANAQKSLLRDRRTGSDSRKTAERAEARQQSAAAPTPPAAPTKKGKPKPKDQKKK